MTRSKSQIGVRNNGTRRRRPIFRGLIAGAAAIFSLLFVSMAASAQASPAVGTQTTPAASASTARTAQARARRRAARRRQRLAQEQQAAQQQQGSTTQVGLTAAQRARDAQILAAQKKQSDAIASENDALTQQYIEAQQKQQAEPRIQDAPGPDSTPLPGDPAIMPAQSSDPPRIQDAPGPAQTLPKAPPSTAPTPAPAPQP